MAGWRRAPARARLSNLAGDEVVLSNAVGQPGQGRLSGLGADRLTGAQLALAPDGSFLALASGSTALGVDLFNQDCVAVGTVDLIRGDLPTPRPVGQPLDQPDQISGGVASGGIAVGGGLDDAISSSIDSVGAPDISEASPAPVSGISGFGGVASSVFE
jgi:hypothetical protein